MSHSAQVRFCKKVRSIYPDYFWNTVVVDIGSLDINGNNRKFFKKAYYQGIDIVAGKNVDVVGKAHEEIPKVYKQIQGIIYKKCRYREQEAPIDVMISTECLEHDENYVQTLQAMYQYLKPGGLMLITCAGVGRKEHGTFKHHPNDSPATNDYYKNVTNEMFATVLPAHYFLTYHLSQVQADLQFFGIKTFERKSLTPLQKVPITSLSARDVNEYTPLSIREAI